MSGIAKATVHALTAGGGVVVRDASGNDRIARRALDVPAELVPGSRVLVATDDDDDAFIVARLGVDETPRGAGATSANAGALQAGADDIVSDPTSLQNPAPPLSRAALVRTTTDGKNVIRCLEGDLELHVDAGRLSLIARDGVTLGAGNQTGARLALTQHGLEARASEISVRARRAEFFADAASAVVSALSIVARKSTSLVGTIEITASRLVEKVDSVQQDVRDLLQTRAGRVRALARGTYQLLGQRTIVKGDDDLKLRSDGKIHLS